MSRPSSRTLDPNESWEVPREMLERGVKVTWLPGLLSFRVCVRLRGLVRLRGVGWSAVLVFGAVVRSSLSGLVVWPCRLASSSEPVSFFF